VPCCVNKTSNKFEGSEDKPENRGIS